MEGALIGQYLLLRSGVYAGGYVPAKIKRHFPNYSDKAPAALFARSISSRDSIREQCITGTQPD